MTIEEKVDKLIIAKAGLKAAVIFLEEVLGTEAALEIGNMPVLNAISAITKELDKIS